MARVPDTTTFNLIQVNQAIFGAQDDLVECFAEAKAYGFDSRYEGSKNSLLNFRNYFEGVSVSPSSIQTDADGGLFVLTIDTRTTWTLTEPVTWIRPSTTSGANLSFPTLEILPNPSTNLRTAQVIISVSDYDATCFVIQNGQQ